MSEESIIICLENGEQEFIIAPHVAAPEIGEPVTGLDEAIVDPPTTGKKAVVFNLASLISPATTQGGLSLDSPIAPT